MSKNSPKGMVFVPDRELFELTQRQQVACTEAAIRLESAFLWRDSPEGYDYWNQVYWRLRSHGVRLN